MGTTIGRKRIEPRKVVTSPRLTQADYKAQAEFRYALRQFLYFSEEIARLHGVTTQRYQALLAIKAAPQAQGITITELATHMQIRHHSAVAMVDRLSAQRLVRREVGITDRRQVYVSLTQRGAELLEKLVLDHRVELHQVWAQLKLPMERLLAMQERTVDSPADNS